ncbi:MAG TPA: glycoside hydrolase domain-containing protein, partial [Armatimonadota bacterium]|nr:glycoside hydrolase domain-containing protein [Armatimonadota bacterium]
LVGLIAIVPFEGDPQPVLARAEREHGRAEPAPDFPRKAESGGVLAQTDDLAVWWDLPTSKVFRDEPLPPERSDGVQLWAARGECEPFQVVLRPAGDLPDVHLECLGLRGEAGEIAPDLVTWHALDYYFSAEQIQPTGFVGDVPDTLLPDRTVTCPAGANQPLWVTVRVPDDQPAGEYAGQVRVLAGERELASVPVRLHVWDFALPQQRSLAMWCPVWAGNLRQHYGRERADELMGAYLVDVADHRAGQHTVAAGPVVKWDEEGNVTSADFAAFDAALAELVARDRLPIFDLPFFTIGYGHIPRDNRFGKADEILTPLWSRKCEGYARALAAHLDEKGLNDSVVMSLFDEPGAEYYPMIRDVVALLRGVEPRWRYTFWGVYAPQLEGAINVWTVPMARYSPRLAEQVRARGEEMWVYNPPGYYIDATAMAVRANYWWVFRQRVPLVYQWTITAWIEWTGSETLWDPHRNASWVIPGEDGPLDTMRFELTREGLEDYEYLAMLERLAIRAEDAGRNDLAAEARALLARTAEIAWTPEDEKLAVVYSQDQNLLHELRKDIGACIEKLSAALE